GNVGSVGTPGAANLTVTAYSGDDARATSQAVSGGLVALSENSSTANVSPTVNATIDSGAVANVTGTVNVTATEDPEGDAKTSGGSKGFVAVGGSVSTSNVTPNVSAYLDTGSVVIAGLNVNIVANNQPVVPNQSLQPTYVINSVNPTDDTLNVTNH